jgi:hypothetical protein
VLKSFQDTYKAEKKKKADNLDKVIGLKNKGLAWQSPN